MFNYKINIGDTILKIVVDRQLSDHYCNRIGICSNGNTPFQQKLMDAISRDRNVINSNPHINPAELIVIEGNVITIKHCVINPAKWSRFTDRIIKKIQYYVAKGEPRKKLN